MLSYINVEQIRNKIINYGITVTNEDKDKNDLIIILYNFLIKMRN